MYNYVFQLLDMKGGRADGEHDMFLTKVILVVILQCTYREIKLLTTYMK